MLGKIRIPQTNDSSLPGAHVVKLQQKTSVCQMRRTTSHQILQQNSRNSSNMRQLQRRLPGQIILVGIPVLLAFLAKKNANKERTQHV